MGIIAESQRIKDGQSIISMISGFVTHNTACGDIVDFFDDLKDVYTASEDITEINQKLTQAQTLVTNLQTKITNALS